jgi:hypothetical protein
MFPKAIVFLCYDLDRNKAKKSGVQDVAPLQWFGYTPQKPTGPERQNGVATGLQAL